jgi:phosphate transport system ATP-binding protein
METNPTISDKAVDPCCREMSPCTGDHKLVVSGLSIFYGDRQVVHQAGFPVCRGCITALIGPSGCGKTSYLMALNRLIELTPGARVEGSIRLDGMNIRDASTDVRSVRKRIGMVFQKPNPFPLSIKENIAFALREHGVQDREDLQIRVQKALELVGLWPEVRDRLNQSALRLSGGQQQRLCIARAIALEPEVLLLDEPCSALDPVSTATIEALLKQLAKSYTVLIVTHNLAQARRISDFCAAFFVKDGIGALIEYGPTEQLFNAPRDPRTADYIQGKLG